MDALDVHSLGERLDLVLCFGILHRVTDPIALPRALADVLTPTGELIIETYGSHLSGDTPAVEVREPGDVYQRDEFVYWGFPAEGLRRVARIAGLNDVEIMAAPDIDGHPRLLAILRSGGPGSVVGKLPRGSPGQTRQSSQRHRHAAHGVWPRRSVRQGRPLAFSHQWAGACV
jgi:SAM-dependent methyltransferase